MDSQSGVALLSDDHQIYKCHFYQTHMEAGELKREIHRFQFKIITLDSHPVNAEN